MQAVGLESEGSSQWATLTQVCEITQPLHDSDGEDGHIAQGITHFLLCSGYVRYRKAWQRLPECRGWLRMGSSTERAHCSVCNKELTAGKSELMKHASGQSHLLYLSVVGKVQLIGFLYNNFFLFDTICVK